MSQHFMTLLEYGSVELHPLIKSDNWLLSSKELATALNVSLLSIIDLLPNLTEEKHYSYESLQYSKENYTSSILFFTKAGIIRIAYSLKSEKSLEFLEFIENVSLKLADIPNHTHKFYKEIEDVLQERLNIIKNDKDISLEEINKFILTLDNLVKKQSGETPTPESSSVSDIIRTVVNLANSYAPKKN